MLFILLSKIMVMTKLSPECIFELLPTKSCKHYENCENVLKLNKKATVMKSYPQFCSCTLSYFTAIHTIQLPIAHPPQKQTFYCLQQAFMSPAAHIIYTLVPTHFTLNANAHGKRTSTEIEYALNQMPSMRRSSSVPSSSHHQPPYPVLVDRFT